MLETKMLKNRCEFTRLRQAPIIRTKILIFKFLPNENYNNEFIKLGFTITKKIGTAVVRNKIRRRLKHATKQIIGELPKNLAKLDVIIFPKKQFLQFSFAELITDLKNGFQQIANLSENRIEKNG